LKKAEARPAGTKNFFIFFARDGDESATGPKSFLLLFFKKEESFFFMQRLG
jgi:hypothetical protein